MRDTADTAVDTATRAPAPSSDARLREPAHHVAPEAVRYWALKSLVGAVIQWVVITGVYVFAIPDSWRIWAGPIAVVLVAISIVELAVVPRWRYRVHRWEVTDTAIYTRSGWLTREQRIAPLSRVQTVDSQRGPLMRLFRLSSITVTTASAAGPITIDCLNFEVAARVVADLTEITARTEGDAT